MVLRMGLLNYLVASYIKDETTPQGAGPSVYLTGFFRTVLPIRRASGRVQEWVKANPRYIFRATNRSSAGPYQPVP